MLTRMGRPEEALRHYESVYPVAWFGYRVSSTGSGGLDRFQRRKRWSTPAGSGRLSAGMPAWASSRPSTSSLHRWGISSAASCWKDGTRRPRRPRPTQSSSICGEAPTRSTSRWFGKGGSAW